VGAYLAPDHLARDRAALDAAGVGHGNNGASDAQDVA
jgi:hypothetical protein